MEETAEPGLEDIAPERCPRCLQPVPPKATRCPGCFQPIQSGRRLSLAIGAGVGLVVLVLVIVVMFGMMRNEGNVPASAPVDEGLTKERDPFDLPPPADGKPAKPEKRPPLDEK